MLNYARPMPGTMSAKRNEMMTTTMKMKKHARYEAGRYTLGDQSRRIGTEARQGGEQ